MHESNPEPLWSDNLDSPTTAIVPALSHTLDPQDLDEAIWSFEDIQSELNYRQAQTALRGLVENLDLTHRERQGLEREINELAFMLDKLDRQVVHIAAFGMVGRGKSSLLNALLGQPIFQTGAIHGVTQRCQAANWTIQEEAVVGSDRPVVRATLPTLNHTQIEVIDTPGIDEVNGEDREALARRIAHQADLILFIVSGDITKVEYQALSALREASKPMILVFNKVDQYPDADRRLIYEKIRDERVKELISADEIVMAAASPMVARAVQHPDGRITAQLSSGEPDVGAVRSKIFEILQREGKALLALNTMLIADDVHEQLVDRKLEIRDQMANRVVWKGVMAKAVAIALNPVTVIDVVSSAVIDVTMLMALSKVYGIAMTQRGAIDLLKTIALTMGGITASELLATFGLSSLKTLLGVAAPATGGLSLGAYVSVAVTQAAVAGVSTYGIGQVVKTYLANGATWGPDGPKAVVTRILESLDETSIMNRIKDELRAKIS